MPLKQKTEKHRKCFGSSHRSLLVNSKALCAIHVLSRHLVQNIYMTVSTHLSANSIRPSKLFVGKKISLLIFIDNFTVFQWCLFWNLFLKWASNFCLSSTFRTVFRFLLKIFSSMLRHQNVISHFLSIFFLLIWMILEVRSFWWKGGYNLI